MTITGWYPRPSSMGYYFSCDYRAALERACQEAVAPDEISQAFAAKQASPSPNADLGTCIHYTMFDGMGCAFDRNEPPTDAQWQNASILFGGNLDRTKQAAFAAATLAASHLPKPRVWRAEVRASSRWTQGTIDLLTEDGTELWDLKTTSKPPLGGNIKAPHLYQLLTYRLLCKSKKRPMPKTGGVIYVDAIGASWCHAMSIDYEDEALVELSDQIEQYTRYLRSNQLFKHAVPRIGTHCSEDWCPFVSVCRNRFIKPLSTGFSRSKPLPSSSPNTLTSLAGV